MGAGVNLTVYCNLGDCGDQDKPEKVFKLRRRREEDVEESLVRTNDKAHLLPVPSENANSRVPRTPIHVCPGLPISPAETGGGGPRATSIPITESGNSRRAGCRKWSFPSLPSGTACLRFRAQLHIQGHALRPKPMIDGVVARGSPKAKVRVTA